MTRFSPFNFIQRARHARGFGIHSPFAFDLITNTIYDNSRFNAFSDINEALKENHLDTGLISSFNRLAFRLVYRFKPENILEINSGKGINTLFLLAADSHAKCTCIETEKQKLTTAKKLLANQSERVAARDESELQSSGKYDMVCIHFGAPVAISPEQLFAKSHDSTFWLIDGINDKPAKQYWSNIVNDERTRFTFDMKRSGIVFLKSSHDKLNFLI